MPCSHVVPWGFQPQRWELSQVPTFLKSLLPGGSPAYWVMPAWCLWAELSPPPALLPCCRVLWAIQELHPHVALEVSEQNHPCCHYCTAVFPAGAAEGQTTVSPIPVMCELGSPWLTEVMVWLGGNWSFCSMKEISKVEMNLPGFLK